MWSDEMDNRIRGAAENDIPAYDDKTWQGMESLLDKHLPQKRKRRGGYIFFLLLGLLLVIPGIFIVSKYSSPNKPLTKQETTVAPGQPTATPGDNNTTTSAPDQDGNTEKMAPAEISAAPVASDINDKNDQPVSSAGRQANSTNNTIAGISRGRNNNDRTSQPLVGKNKITARNSSTTATVDIDVINAGTGNNKNTTTVEQVTAVTPSATITATGNKQPTKENSSMASILPPVTGNNQSSLTEKAATEKTVDATKKSDSSAIAANDPVEKKKQQPAGKKGNKFMLTFSIGPDLTSVGTSRTGKVEGQYGIGIGYAVTNHLTVRTGLYAGKKIYTADSNSYNYAYNSGGGYRLYKVDANCLVYEVPVTIAYNFKGTEKHNWFVSTGLSSYFMKDEKYVYNFKTSGGQVVAYDHQYKNENQHIFSVLNLSGGYQYNFSKRFSLLTEPYIKLPIGGIGEGKVKLNSAGVLFTAVIRPFAH